MKSFVSLLVGSITLFLFLSSVKAAGTIGTRDGASCSATKRDDSYFSVVGVQGTGVQPRQELRELQKDSELWNMFILALIKFQAMDQDEKTSYYEIAGIHGVPFKPWDKVDPAPGQQKMGYCPHSSSIFGPWHRPYLALFEQILHDRAVDVANEYPIGQARNKALDLAARVRLPFWDWARNTTGPEDGVIPKIIRVQHCTVTFPNGTVAEVFNPLHRYKFHPLPREVFAELVEYEFKAWEHTIRYPLHPYFANATSRDDDVNDVMGKQQTNIRDTVYKLLTTYQPYSQVSNKANGGKIGNFESLHDSVHNVFGLGHMGIVEVSAFDPVFWFHHCNVDRLLAIFQARYPETWVEDAKQATGTYAIPRGSVLGTASPLPPFHMNALGDTWTSTTVRNWTAFGYTYPELVGNPSNSTLTSTISQLYKPQTPGLSTDNTTTPTPGGNNDTQPAPGGNNDTQPAPGGNNDTQPALQVTEWSCEVNMPSNIQISYAVRAFLGEPSSNPADWPLDENCIGQFASMSSPRSKADHTVTGSIGLSDALKRKYEAGELKSMDKATVQAYLKKNFSWRIQALDLSEIPRSKPPSGLNVTVCNVEVSLPESDSEVPVLESNVQYHTEIQGNPPVYDGPGPDGTNSTLPANRVTGQYDATSGQFIWKNATLVSAIENSNGAEPMLSDLLLKPISMPFAGNGPPAPSAPAPPFALPSFAVPSFAVPSFAAPHFSIPSFAVPSFDVPSLPGQPPSGQPPPEQPPSEQPPSEQPPSGPFDPVPPAPITPLPPAPEPTPPPGPHTAFVTSFVVEYITVM